MSRVVAVVGRPNVGKSTLINRICGSRAAIVSERPGLTRDRVSYPAEWAGQNFTLLDTGGMGGGSLDPLEDEVSEIALEAARQANVIMFVVDASAGVSAPDKDLANVLRRMSKPVVVAANKADNRQLAESSWEFSTLGLGEPHAVSAVGGRGIGDLLDRITSKFDAESGDDPEAGVGSVAIVGRPNVGKSSLFNMLSSKKLSMVHPIAGTTRDTVDTMLEGDFGKLLFIDTAGLARGWKMESGVEYYGGLRTSAALERADCALVLMDVSQGVVRQDLRVIGEATDAGCSMVVVANKVDLDETLGDFTVELRRRMRSHYYLDVIGTSAITGKGVKNVLPNVAAVLNERTRRVPTNALNELALEVQGRAPIPRGQGRIRFVVQAESVPPTFVVFGAGPMLPVAWTRYFERSIRGRFGFAGTPISIVGRS